MKASDIRRKQIKFIQKKLINTPCAILMGDSNMISEKENHSITDKYKDMFIDLQIKGHIPHSELGLTFDLISNKMGKKLCGWVQQSRLDRIFISDENILPQTLSIIGNHPIKCHHNALWISDHYGLVGKIQLIISK